MSVDPGDSNDVHALKALGLAVVGLVLGVFAFRLHLHGGDEKFLTYILGGACSGFCISTLAQLVKALKAKSTPQAGAASAGRVLVTAFTVTLVGVVIFTLSSVLAVFMSTLKDLSGIEILVGLVAALIPFLGPIVLGARYFYWLQQALCESGWNTGAALLAATSCAGASIISWYALNIIYGPQVYGLLIS